MKHTLLLLLALSSLFTVQAQNFYLLAGTYTYGKSKGIYVYEFNSTTGTATLADSMITSNPSYLAVAPNQKFVYAVSEEGKAGGGGKVKAFAFDTRTGKLSFLNEQPTGGDHPCYVTVDRTGAWVLVGNYTSGNAASFKIQEDGRLGSAWSVVQHFGNGPNKKRQNGPHVHATVFSPDNKFLFAPDLGTDKIVQYSFDEKTGSLLRTNDDINLEPGSGPRHFEFHPNRPYAYLVQELSGTITAFEYEKDKLKPIQAISTLPDGFNKNFTSADIHVSYDGKFLYASNRDSSNTIAVFKVGNGGKLKLVDHQASLGINPRNFNFDPTGNFLLVANQNSDNIVIFRIDRKSGLLTDTGTRIDIGNPVCVKWAAKM